MILLIGGVSYGSVGREHAGGSPAHSLGRQSSGVPVGGY